MKTRLLSFFGIWLTIGLIVFLCVHGETLALLAGLVVLVALGAAAHREFCVLLGACGGRPNMPLSVTLGVLVTAVLAWGALDPSAPLKFNSGLRTALPGVIAGALALGLLLWSPAKLTAVFAKASTGLSWLFVPCSLMPLVVLATEFWRVESNPSGLLLVIWVIAAVKFTDCGGLIVGCSIGRHKLAPSISPKKTWEGCVGGVVASVLVAAGLAWLFARFAGGLRWKFADELTPQTAALLAVPLAVLSVPSDLVESVFKRKAGVKDSGATVPGIGGAFDLLDSLLIPAPAAFLLLKIFVLRETTF
jgi:phosphatidate cytidylyltransferase